MRGRLGNHRTLEHPIEDRGSPGVRSAHPEHVPVIPNTVLQGQAAAQIVFPPALLEVGADQGVELRRLLVSPALRGEEPS